MKSKQQAIQDLIKNKYRLLIVSAFVLVMIFPVLYYGVPWFGNSPDIYYVKAKVLQVQEGNLFTDPVSGMITMHPPIYHVVLAGLVFIGCRIDLALVIITILNVALLIFFVYRIMAFLYGSETAFISCLLISFIIEFMGSQSILLAASFNFSVVFFLWGLWIYIKSADSLPRVYFSSLLWGVAFIISPVYIFLLGLILIRDTIINKSMKRLLLIAGIFGLTISSFIYQSYLVYSHDLHHTTTFALWRGMPDAAWWWAMAQDFLTPGAQKTISLPTAIYVLVLAIGLWYMIKQKHIYWFLPLSFLAYLLTYYHFSNQYAIRIQLFFSLFWVAWVVRGMLSNKTERFVELIALLFIITYSIYNHYAVALDAYKRWSAGHALYEQIGKQLWKNLDEYIDDNEFLFCTKDTYFRFLMTQKPVHALGAYKTMDYYQLDSMVSKTLEYDYAMVINSRDPNVINGIATKYGVKTAVASSRDYGLPLFQALGQYWKPVYKDEYFTIFKDGSAARSPAPGS